MILPMKRAALGERNRLDEIDEAEQYQRETPGDRVRIALALSALTRKLANAVGNDWESSPPTDLADKARRYADPLRRLCRT